jgi:hypothetical protein
VRHSTLALHQTWCPFQWLPASARSTNQSRPRLYPSLTIVCRFRDSSSLDALHEYISQREEGGDYDDMRTGRGVGRVGSGTYPMNHAPLSAYVPFCRQARKWCPPAKLSQHVPQTGK